MALLYSYGTGSSASADRYSTVDELLTQIPDNTANLIVAQDIRDSVFTLWERIGDVETIAGSAASASSFFQNTSPTPVTVGGITAGTTFPTPTDMQTMWNLLLYPYVAPGASLTYAGTSTRQYGDSLSLNLNWVATQNSNAITSIIVDSVSQPLIPLSGTKLATGTHSTSPGPSETSIFSMSVDDGISITNDTYTLTWKNKIYWGTVDLSSIGNPNLTTNPGSASLVATLCTDSAIKSAGGSQLSSTKNKTYDNIDGAGEHLIFAWPSNLTGSLFPVFTVNGLQSTAFTRIRSSVIGPLSSNFSNEFGFVDEYEVWVSNTIQNSPIDVTISD